MNLLLSILQWEQWKFLIGMRTTKSFKRANDEEKSYRAEAKIRKIPEIHSRKNMLKTLTIKYVHKNFSNKYFHSRPSRCQA